MAVLSFFWLVASNISIEKGVRNQISPPEPLQATGIDDSAIENSQFASSARRSAQDAKPCLPSATGCDDDAFKPPAKNAPKPLCITDLGDTVQASATDCEPCFVRRRRTSQGLIAEEGLELVVVFAGKSYILSAAGDKLGIISARETR